ncbi:MAG: hypothetical protein ACRDZ0_08130, partial [Acidimicrobiales bacterium]
LVTTAESVTGTVDSASRLAYIAKAHTLIKGVAYAIATEKSSRRHLGRRDDNGSADGGSGKGER